MVPGSSFFVEVALRFIRYEKGHVIMGGGCAGGVGLWRPPVTPPWCGDRTLRAGGLIGVVIRRGGKAHERCRSGWVTHDACFYSTVRCVCILLTIEPLLKVLGFGRAALRRGNDTIPLEGRRSLRCHNRCMATWDVSLARGRATPRQKSRDGARRAQAEAICRWGHDGT